MIKNRFVDVVGIVVKAGDGGAGTVSFKRDKFVPKGGPDGGDGGKGGDVVFKADQNLSTLMDFRAKPVYKAQFGERGKPKTKTGKNGDDLVIDVPVGTLIYLISEDESETPVGDLVTHNQRLLVAFGGAGGRGNYSFRSSTNRTPEQSTSGKKGEEKKIRLEIKMLADIGLIGFPNAGKSTLINKLTGTKAKVAGYPFTTLNPNLGVYKMKNGREVIIADIPGLVEGASSGKGLGDDFLRHIERTSMLVHLIDPSQYCGEEGVAAKSVELYKAIRKELGSYSKLLLEKDEIVAVNKIDMVDVLDVLEDIKNAFDKEGIDAVGISAVTGEGINILADEILKRVGEREEVVEESKLVKVYTIGNLPNKRVVFRNKS